MAGVSDIAAGAAGNIGVNVAAGAFNNQSNATLISNRLNATSATTTTTQSTTGLKNILAVGTRAYASGNAFAGAAGNIGLNIASGIANQQSNTLVAQP